MNRIQNSLLNNTLSLLQLAREAAKEKGSTDQVERFEPVVDHLTNLLASSEESVSSNTNGILAQNDFATLLKVINSEKSTEDANSRMKEKNNMIYAMAAGGMNDLEIARYMGITRDEVRIVMNLSKQDNSGGSL
jgi:hypothetical protein